MNPEDIKVITDHGMPLAIASVVFVGIKMLRSQLVQSMLALVSSKLVWANWPKPVCLAVVVASAGAAALATAIMQGTPLLSALPTALVAAVGAMGIDAGHGAIKEPDSTATMIRDAGSLKVELPQPKP